METTTNRVLKKNNSNIYACEGSAKFNGPLWRELRKQRFRKSVPEKDAQFHMMLAWSAEDQFSLAELRMDIEKFKKTLDPDLQQVLALFLHGHSPKEITARTGCARSTSYRKLHTIFTKFKTFYLGDK